MTPHREPLPVRRTLAVGAALVAAGAMLVLSPLLLGKGGPIKYVVTLGVMAFCLGASILLHTAIDLIRRR